MCNCNNTYQTTICQPQIPCDQTDCSCPVKDLSTDCILYTGDTLGCSGIEGQTILTELIQQLDAYICTALDQANSSINLINVGTGVQIYKGVDVLGKREIRSLKTTNPIITIGLAGESKEIAFGIDETELTNFITENTTPGLSGLGIEDYVARWTPNGTTLGTGIIRDDNTSVGINIAPDAGTVLSLRTTSNEDKGIYSVNDSTSITNKNAVYGLTSGTNTAENRGLEGIAQDSTSSNVGVVGVANSGTGVAVGGSFSAQGPGTKYAVKLRDNTEGVGKVLTCMTANGEANWVTPATGITGLGINNYVARWTPSGTQLGTGLIQDDTISIGINSAPLTGSKFNVSSNLAVGISSTQTVQGIGMDIRSQIAGASNNFGAIFFANNSTSQNVSIEANAISGTTSTNIGIRAVANGGLLNYSAQLLDGTEGIGKVLTCITADGKANWVDANPQKFITYPADFIGTNYTLTNADNGYSIVIDNATTAVTITVPNGLVAKMQVGFIQDGSADVTFVVAGTLKTALTGADKIKGQYDQVYLEQGINASTYYLLGNTKL